MIIIRIEIRHQIWCIRGCEEPDKSAHPLSQAFCLQNHCISIFLKGVLLFNDTSTLVDCFVSSDREREKMGSIETVVMEEKDREDKWNSE